MKSTLGQRLKDLREEYRLSQTAFAERIGISYVAYANIERGITVNPQEATISSIIKEFATTYEWLLDNKGDMLPNGKAQLTNASAESSGNFNPATDTLYKELREQIVFYRGLLTQMAGGKSFRLAPNQTGHKRRLGAAA